MIGTILFAALLVPSDQAVQAILASATAGWGPLDRRTIDGGEIRLEDARQGRVATYRFDRSGVLVMLAVNSACGSPFPDRAGLAALVVRSIDPGASPLRIRYVTNMLTYDWSSLGGGNAAVRVGAYIVAGHRIGGTGCQHDYLSIERAGLRSGLREAPL